MNRRTELRRLRRARDLTLAVVTARTGIHTGTLSLIERGRYVPSPTQGAALAEFFGRPIDELLADAVVEPAPQTIATSASV